MQLLGGCQILADLIPRINLHIVENKHDSTICTLFEGCEFIRGMQPQAAGNEREAATLITSARCEFIRGMRPQAAGNEREAAMGTASASC